jgi:putative acetyltransferase
MVYGPDYSRSLLPAEMAEVDSLLLSAFPSSGEVDLVHRLRADGFMVHEHVIPWEDRIGAYAAISRMKAPHGWFCLGPVAVMPEWQNGVLGLRNGAGSMRNSWRFGTRLVRTFSELFSKDVHFLPRAMFPGNPPTLVVVGRPSFYARCGFSLERAARLTSPYPIANTLIARAGEDVPEETLVYPPAFDGV